MQTTARAIALATLACMPAATASAEEYLVAASNSIQRYSLEGDYLGDLVAPGTALPGASQFALSPDRGTLYVGTFGAAANVAIFDAHTGAALGNLDNGGPLQGPSVVTFSHTGSLLVSDFVGGNVWEYNPATRERLGTFFSGTNLVNPHEVLWTGEKYLVSDYATSRVNVFDAEGAFERVMLQGPADFIANPLDMILSDDGSRLYVSNNASGRITVYDTETESIVRSFGGGRLRFPEGLAWAPDGSLVVANAGLGNILRFDPETGAVLDEFERLPGVTRGTTDVLLIPTPPTAAALAATLLLTRRRR